MAKILGHGKDVNGQSDIETIGERMSLEQARSLTIEGKQDSFREQDLV
jgi:hypothetical protein